MAIYPTTPVPDGSTVRELHPYDVMVYQEGGHYYAKDRRGNLICVDSPTACIQEAMNYLQNGGKIYIRHGRYFVNKTIVLPWNGSYGVIIEGDGMVNSPFYSNIDLGGTYIYISAPAQLISYNQWQIQQTGTSTNPPYPLLFIRDLGIFVYGNYSNVTNPPIALSRVWCELENVHLEAGGYFNSSQGFILGMCYGSGPPGWAPVWKNVYLWESVESITGSGLLTVLYHKSEGFRWIGGGIGINHTVTSGNLAILNINAMNHFAMLENIPIFISGAVPKGGMYAFAVNNGCNTLSYYIKDIYLNFAGAGNTASGRHDFEAIYGGCPSLPNIPGGYTPVGVIAEWDISIPANEPLVPPPPLGGIKILNSIRSQNVSVTPGTSGNYGSSSFIDLYFAIINAITINVSGVASGETITVNLTFYHVDGSSQSMTKQFTSNTTYQLTPSDLVYIANTIPLWYLQVQASSNLSSTTASMTVQAVTQ
jgi:hypothetical protein